MTLILKRYYILNSISVIYYNKFTVFSIKIIIFRLHIVISSVEYDIFIRYCS